MSSSLMIFEFALAIFNKITPETQQPHVQSADDAIIMRLGDEGAFAYFDSFDQQELNQLQSVFADAFVDVLSDERINLEDIPRLLLLVRNVVSKVNEFHDMKRAGIVASELCVVSFLRVVTLLLFQMFLPKSQYHAIFNTIDASFELIQTSVVMPTSGPFDWLTGCLLK